MKYKIILQEGKEAIISAECLGDAHTQAIKQWGTSVSGVMERDESVVSEVDIGHTRDEIGLTTIGSFKHDTDKPDYSLLEWAFIEEMARVLGFGLKKYNKRGSWKDIPNARDRYLAAAFRHLSAYAQEELFDSESGLSHLAHLAINALFLYYFDNSK